MLSIGIRSGQGFDKVTISKFLAEHEKSYDFDVLILGTNPGGMICARQASNSGMKTALVHWRLPTPGEEDIHEKSKFQMMDDLEMTELDLQERTRKILTQENMVELMDVIERTSHSSNDRMIQVQLQKEIRRPNWWRKVRRSKLDLKNSVRNMSLEGMKYMHDIAVGNEISRSKHLQPISWGKMMERLFDHIIGRNWNILTDLLMRRISVYNGVPRFIDENTVKVILQNGKDIVISAEIVISAVEVHYSFPMNILGAREFCVNFDDFYRLSSSPGKTLVIGDGFLGLECAGILASFNFPVDIIFTAPLLEKVDKEIIDIIMIHLKAKGVNLIEHKSLVSVQKSRTGQGLVAELISTEPKTNKSKIENEEYDTILFTNREEGDRDIYSNNALKMEIERLSGEVMSLEERERLKNVTVIPDIPGDAVGTEYLGRSIWNRLFENEEALPKSKIIPTLVYTPLEYAYFGTSENMAKRRLGQECVTVFSGDFQIQNLLPGTAPLVNVVCFIKIICLLKYDLVLGLHILGNHAVRIMKKILENSTDKLLITNLHPTIYNQIPELQQEIGE